MNDFDYDVYQKKVVARSALKRKCGSKSKKCTLPHENLTKAQRKKLDGEVMSFNMNQPTTWKHFKEMSKTTQAEYLNNLISEYRVTASALGDMLGIGGATLRKYAKSAGLPVEFSIHGRMSNDSTRKWNVFLGGEDVGMPTEPEFPADSSLPEEIEEPTLTPDQVAKARTVSEALLGCPKFKRVEPLAPSSDRVVSVEPVSFAPVQKEARSGQLSEFSLCFTGAVNPSAVYNALVSMLDKDATGTLKVTFTRE